MTTEYLLVQYGSNRQTVETVSEGFPQSNVVSPFTWREREREGGEGEREECKGVVMMSLIAMEEKTQVIAFDSK